MSDEDRERRREEFWRAQARLDRALKEARNLAPEYRAKAEAQAWSNYKSSL